MKNFSILFILYFASCQGGEQSDAGNNLPDKEQELVNLLAQYPDSTKLVENLAQYYRDNNDYEKAIEVVNNGLERDSTIPVYWHMKGVLHFENNDTALAISALEKSAVFTKNISDILLLARLYAETGNVSALQLTDAVIQQNTFVKEALFIKGIYFTTTGDDQKAMSHFDEAIAVSYTFVEAFLEKAKILYKQQKHMDALRVLDKALKIRNNYAEGYYEMGRNFEQLSRIDDAKESYQTALIYDPEYAEAKAALNNLKDKTSTDTTK